MKRWLALAVLAANAHVAHANPAADAALVEGRRLYDLQEWDKAIAKFKEAYTLREDAASLFNIAQAYRLKGDCAQAAGFYKTFKRKFPTEKPAQIDKFIADMEACAKAAPPPPTLPPPAPVEPTPPPVVVDKPLPPPPPAPESSGGGLRIASYAALGAGVVGLGVGVTFGVIAMGKSSDAEAATTWMPSLEEDGEAAQRNATIGFVAGGALVAAGVVMFVLSRSDEPTVAVVPSAEGAQFVWSGRF